MVDEQSLSKNLSAIINGSKWPCEFPKAVMNEASSIETKISKEEISRRRDLRNLVTVTIDGENARDFDDAVSAEDIGNGKLRLYVSIADVSHYVKQDTAIDQEACARGTSVYFPSRVLPMLPEKLSNDICSLIPNKDRLTMTAEMDFDKEGALIRSDFYRSVICSARRLTYRQVARALEKGKKNAQKELEIPNLELMKKLFLCLRKARLERGSLDFDLPEPEIIMDMEEGRIESILKSERTEAHMMIEEFMIAANEAVASVLTKKDLPILYRIHPHPTAEKLGELQKTLHNLGYPLKISNKKVTPKSLAAIVKRAAGKPEGRMINTLMLRSMAKAVYSTENPGHFGLASTCYTHFTSPIRRYPDLVIHRILGRMIDGKKGQMDLRHLEQIAEHCSLRERTAMEIEWAVRDLFVAVFMKDHVGQTYSGIISNVTKFGIFVELTSHFVEGLVHIRNLDDYFRFIPERHCLIGRKTKKRYRIGDPIRIRVARVDVEKRWVDFEPV